MNKKLILDYKEKIDCEVPMQMETLPLAEEQSFSQWQQEIPKEYFQLSPDEIINRITKLKKNMGNELIILGHHYQREDIIQFADQIGDSYALSVYAANNHSTPNIVFCGVHFMAEAADILSNDEQKIILPNLEAGCSMADMANRPDVSSAWKELTNRFKDQFNIIPITYINSPATLKAFCGQNNGIVCTSSNADKVIKWAFERGDKVFFFPDQHLGRNTSHQLGINDDLISLWDWRRPDIELGGNSEEKIRKSKVILWDGFCSVHQRFTVSQIKEARSQYPRINIVVHPECNADVVKEADAVGSTAFIADYVNNAKDGSIIGVGTEVNLVSRLAKLNPQKQIFCLDSVVCPCSTMYRVHPAYLLWVIESLSNGKVVNQIKVPEKDKAFAKIALERMLEIS
ncbi:MAG: quinolinate synthase NadA [Dehalococcoidia bacterium]|nr:quinolinate synthase NadA [Dehalococcoidia bacterium]